jgi:hypothetical protein
VKVGEKDIASLRKGEPPCNEELLVGMTLGREHWLDRFKEHYLENYIGRGNGSKVKVLTGKAGTGKTHLLRCIEQDACSLGYAVVFISLRDIVYKLNNIPSLYRAIIEQIDQERLVRGLCCRVAENLGYGQDLYDGTVRLLPRLVEEGLPSNDACREIRKATGRVFQAIDVEPSFRTFCFIIANGRMVHSDQKTIDVALKWLSGGQLERFEKQATGLYEKLQKSNARAWLNSLIHIIKIAGMTGLVVIIDDIEVMTEKSVETGRYIYTMNAVRDTCELFRQLIDDTELLNNFLLLLSGRREVIEDAKRGFNSYEALWMRLQTGLVPNERFNPFSDIVDVDAHLATNGTDFPRRVVENLNRIIKDAGYKIRYRDLFNGVEEESDLRKSIVECAKFVESEVVESDTLY